jgi:two-component system, OmpR family, sensor histidine kinase TctE
MVPARSIRSTLTIWLLGPLLVLSGILLLDAFVDAQRRTTSAYDRLLAAVAISISQNIRIEGGSLRVNLPFSTLAYSESLSNDHLYYEVISDSSGSDGYPALPTPPRVPNLGTPTYYNAEYRGKRVRAAFLRGQASRIDGVSGYSVIVAETLGQRSAQARSMLGRSAVRLSILVLVASLIVWIGIRNGLRPLSDLETSVRRRSPEDLRPISYQTPAETKALVASLNAFMVRLKESLEALERFAGNVGHQLRTPLGVIQANAALVRRRISAAKRNELLTDMESAASDLARMVDQLLLMSRVSARRADKSGREIIALDALVAETVKQTALVMDKSGLHPELQIAVTDLHIAADPVLVEGLLLNLLDNAQRHAAPGSLEVRVGRANRYAFVEVEDDGPGIPSCVADAAFSRHPNDATDHGLGLSICAEIARHLGGDIALQPPRHLSGAHIVVRLPLAIRFPEVHGG